MEIYTDLFCRWSSFPTLATISVCAAALIYHRNAGSERPAPTLSKLAKLSAPGWKT